MDMWVISTLTYDINVPNLNFVFLSFYTLW